MIKHHFFITNISFLKGGLGRSDIVHKYNTHNLLSWKLYLLVYVYKFVYGTNTYFNYLSPLIMHIQYDSNSFMMGEYKCTRYCAASVMKYLEALLARVTGVMYKIQIRRDRRLNSRILVILISFKLAVMYVKFFTNSCSIVGDSEGDHIKHVPCSISIWIYIYIYVYRLYKTNAQKHLNFHKIF